MTAAATTERRHPTPDAPDHGAIGYRDIILSPVDYWIEDGDHVFRSTEFDIIGSGADFREAIAKFVENAEDYARVMADLVREDEATPDEAEAAVALLERFAEVYRAEKDRLEQDTRRLVRINLRRRGQDHPRAGYQPSPPRNSSELQPA